MIALVMGQREMSIYNSLWVKSTTAGTTCRGNKDLPSGNLTLRYWKWSFIVDFPINSMVIFQFANRKRLPEGMSQ